MNKYLVKIAGLGGLTTNTVSGTIPKGVGGIKRLNPKMFQVKTGVGISNPLKPMKV